MTGAPVALGRRRWHQEPLVWLLVAIPLSSVVMGGVLLWLSIASYDGLVADDYYKRGLEIDRVLARDDAARRLGLEGALRIGAGGTRLRLDAAAQGFRSPAALDVDLSYATRAGMDRRVRLMRLAPGDYAGPVVDLPAGRWYVQAATGEWRITGTLDTPGSGRVSLVPAAATR